MRPFQNNSNSFYRNIGLMQVISIYQSHFGVLIKPTLYLLEPMGSKYVAGVISAFQSSETSTAWEELMGVEKLLIHTIYDERSSLQQLIELLSVGKCEHSLRCVSNKLIESVFTSALKANFLLPMWWAWQSWPTLSLANISRLKMKRASRRH